MLAAHGSVGCCSGESLGLASVLSCIVLSRSVVVGQVILVRDCLHGARECTLLIFALMWNGQRNSAILGGLQQPCKITWQP